MPASSQASSELSTASLTVVSSALAGLSNPSRCRFFVKNSLTEISRCFEAIDSAVARRGGLGGASAALMFRQVSIILDVCQVGRQEPTCPFKRAQTCATRRRPEQTAPAPPTDSSALMPRPSPTGFRQSCVRFANAPLLVLTALRRDAGAAPSSRAIARVRSRKTRAHRAHEQALVRVSRRASPARRRGTPARDRRRRLRRGPQCATLARRRRMRRPRFAPR